MNILSFLSETRGIRGKGIREKCREQITVISNQWPVISIPPMIFIDIPRQYNNNYVNDTYYVH